MGLTIHWQFQSTDLHEDDARAAVAALRERALDMPFQHVGDLIDREGEACEFHPHEQDNPHSWLLVQAAEYIKLADGETYRSVTPERLIAFSTAPGQGCEQANFGLCLYPESIGVTDPDDESQKIEVPTGLKGWCWTSSCKTQYASDPNCGGMDNFLRSHLNVVSLLDHARELGMLGEVTDESEFWQHRNLQQLAEIVGKWNQMTAAFVGQLKDLYGGQFTAAITNFPNFEHLEAEGRREE